MRIYYCAQAEGQSHHVRSALGVDAGAWNSVYRRLQEWRADLERRYDIPAESELRACDLVAAGRPAQACNCGNHENLDARLGLEVLTGGMRCIDDIAREVGGIGVINVCLDKQEVPSYRRVGLDRLFNRVNATAAQDGGHAFVIFGQEPEEMITRLCRRLRNYNPVPAGQDDRNSGQTTRNLPIERVIGGPAFRTPASDHLLQAAALVAHALLWQEEPPAHCNAASGVNQAFSILDRALNRRAARRDPQGVVRR